MCGRYALVTSPELLAALLHLHRVHIEMERRYNIAPTQTAPVMRMSAEGDRELVPMRWGLIPSWAKDSRIGSKLINARSESAATKPAFRSAMKQRRCIIPASGFYEWQKIDDRTKQPFYVQRADQQPMLMAGLWEYWRDPESEQTIKSYTVLTTAANEQLRPLHDRMPVILEPEDIECWLPPGSAESERAREASAESDPDQSEAITKLLRSAAEGVLVTHPVSSRVNSPRNDDPSLIEPVRRETAQRDEPQEPGLFD